MEPIGQSDQRFAGILVSSAFRISNCIGEPVIHERHAGGVRVSEPCHLDRRGLVCKSKETVILCVPGQVHKDINAVFTDFFRDDGMGFPNGVIPMVSKFPDPLCYIIGPQNLCVAENLHLGTVMGLEQGFQKIGARVTAKIRRHIPHAKPSFGCRIIDMRQYFRCQRFCMGLVPVEMLLKHPIRSVTRTVLQGEQHVAVGLMISGLDLQRFFVAVHCFPDNSLVIERDTHVAVGLGKARLDLNGLPVIFDGFSGPGLIPHRIPHIVIGFGEIGIDRYGFAVSGNGIVNFALVFQGISDGDMAFPIIRVDLQRFSAGSNCLIKSSLFFQHNSYIVINFC